jgi:hypothetical protein
VERIVAIGERRQAGEIGVHGRRDLEPPIARRPLGEDGGERMKGWRPADERRRRPRQPPRRVEDDPPFDREVLERAQRTMKRSSSSSLNVESGVAAGKSSSMK